MDEMEKPPQEPKAMKLFDWIAYALAAFVAFILGISMLSASGYGPQPLLFKAPQQNPQGQSKPAPNGK